MCYVYIFFWRALYVQSYLPTVIKAHYKEFSDLVHKYIVPRTPLVEN